MNVAVPPKSQPNKEIIQRKKNVELIQLQFGNFVPYTYKEGLQ
jgi:hypothetical protein